MSAVFSAELEAAKSWLSEIDWREDGPEVIQAQATVALTHALIALIEGLRDQGTLP